MIVVWACCSCYWLTVTVTVTVYLRCSSPKVSSGRNKRPDTRESVAQINPMFTFKGYLFNFRTSLVSFPKKETRKQNKTKKAGEFWESEGLMLLFISSQNLWKPWTLSIWPQWKRNWSNWYSSEKHSRFQYDSPKQWQLWFPWSPKTLICYIWYDWIPGAVSSSFTC